MGMNKNWINSRDPGRVEWLYSQVHNSELEGALQMHSMTQSVTEEEVNLLEFQSIISVDFDSR